MINVIIPVYKAGRTLRRTLESLVWQSYKDFKVTMIQDGDHLNYKPICKAFRDRGLDITLLELEENVGPGRARQFGLDNSEETDYICFLDADDMILPEGLKILMDNIGDADIISSNFLIGDNMVSDTHRPCTWFHGNLYKTAYLKEKNIRFSPRIRYNEDSYFNFIAFNLTKNIKRIEDVTRIWCDNEESVTRKDPLDFFNQSWKDYIYGMCDGLKVISANGGELTPKTVAATLSFVYSSYMTAKYYEYDTTEEEALLLSIKPIVAPMTIQSDFWIFLHENLTQTRIMDTTLIFYQDNFKNWLDTYIMEMKQ